MAAAETAAAAAAAAASCSLECRRSARRRRELSGLRRRGSRIIFALCPSLSWVCFSSSHEIFFWCFSSSSTRRRLKTLDDDFTRSVTVHSSGEVGVGWVSRPCDGVSQSGRNRGSWSRRGYSGDIQVVVCGSLVGFCVLTVFVVWFGLPTDLSPTSRLDPPHTHTPPLADCPTRVQQPSRAPRGGWGPRSRATGPPATSRPSMIQPSRLRPCARAPAPCPLPCSPQRSPLVKHRPAAAQRLSEQ